MREDGRTWIVALALAIALGLAVILITAGVLYDAIFSEGPGLSDNATQVLTMAFGGIIGVLGSYVGFRAGSQVNGATDGFDLQATERATAGSVRNAETTQVPDADESASATGGDR